MQQHVYLPLQKTRLPSFFEGHIHVLLHNGLSSFQIEPLWKLGMTKSDM